MRGMVLKGDICYTKTRDSFTACPNSWLVCADGRVKGVYGELPEEYKELPVFDYTGKLIVPGMTDLHVHAPQYAYRALGMDLELLEWLDTITFPQEAKYADIEYAQKAYEIFVDDMKESVTTRACVFATLHTPATKILMDMFEKSGLKAYVGKVNMDRNSPDFLCESTEQSVKATEEWLEETTGKYENVKPIITPRFTPSCSDELMRELSRLQKKSGVPVQSHLSENMSEISWVAELCPDADGYADAYNRFGMFGGGCPTIMAHCVHMRDDEIDLMARNGVFVAHSPQSNINLKSGVAPVKTFLDRGVKVGLATDMAAGAHLSMFRCITDAVQASKIRWRLLDETVPALTISEAFYIATKGGGEFFGKAGSFEEDYEFDAVVIDDSQIRTPLELSLTQRLERALYLAESKDICAKFVSGKKIK